MGKSKDVNSYLPLYAVLYSLGPLLLTLIPAWISNYIHCKVWDEITYPFPNFNSATIEILGMAK